MIGSSTNKIYTRRLKFSNFLVQFFFMIKYANVLDMRFIDSVLTISLFIPILCTFLMSTICHAMFKKSCQSRAQHSTCSPWHLNSIWLIGTCAKTYKQESNLKISLMECRSHPTLYQRNIAIGMLTAGMMNKQVA